MCNQQKDIFISYCRRDIEKVKRFKKEIEAETQVQCWMDLEGIESGNPKFTKIIVRAINSCPIFLFMLSGASQQSENALKELDFAYDKCREEGKKVVIVYIEACKMNDEFKFDYQKADTIDWHNPLQKEKLIRDLKIWTNYENKLPKSNQQKLVLSESEEQQWAEEVRTKREAILREAEAERKRKYEERNGIVQGIALFSSIISLFCKTIIKKSTICWISSGIVAILIIVFGLRMGNTRNHELSPDVSRVPENIKIEEDETESVEDVNSRYQSFFSKQKKSIKDSTELESQYKSNLDIWLEAQKTQLKIEAQLESYEQLVSEESEKTPNFGLR